MDIQFYGANCITITTKQIRLVFDDNLAELGAKSITKPGDISLFTSEHEPVAGSKMSISSPGEYEISGVSIKGIQARAHMDKESERSAIIYKVVVGDVSALVVGHAYPGLSEARLEEIGRIDVMLIPVGGNGYTLDAEGSMQIVKQVEPKIAVPTHYADKSLSYEVPQVSLEDAIKALGVEVQETVSKLSLKTSDGADSTRLIVLERS